MRGVVTKLIRRKVMMDLNRKGLEGKAKIVAFNRGCRETKKQYKMIGKPALPKVIHMNKQHAGESSVDFRARRKISNNRRREKEKRYGYA